MPSLIEFESGNRNGFDNPPHTPRAVFIKRGPCVIFVSTHKKHSVTIRVLIQIIVKWTIKYPKK